MITSSHHTSTGKKHNLWIIKIPGQYLKTITKGCRLGMENELVFFMKVLIIRSAEMINILGVF